MIGGDLKVSFTQCVLFVSFTASDGHVKLTDFGLSEISHKITLKEILLSPKSHQAI
jgi:hypothetical protein